MKKRTLILNLLVLSCLIAPIISSQNNFAYAATYFNSETQEPTNYFTTLDPQRIVSNFGEDASSQALINWQVSPEVEKQIIKVAKVGEEYSKQLELRPSNTTAVDKFYKVTNPVVNTSYNLSGTMTLWGTKNSLVKPAENLARYVCRVELNDLEENTRYKYSVGYGSNWSEDCFFETAPRDGDFQFSVFSDPQDGGTTPYANTTKVTERIANSESNFALCLGDISDLGEYESYYDSFFKTQSFTKKMQFTTIPGNHEALLFESLNYSYNEKKGEARWYNANFYNPQNGPTGYKDHLNEDVDRNSSYYFKYNDCLFINLNTQFDSPYLVELASWVDKVITNNPSKYIFVSMHKGCYGNYYYGAQTAIYSVFANTFEKHDVDLVMSGHDHTFARTAAVENFVKTDYAGDGTVYWIVASPGPKLNKPAEDAGWQFEFRNSSKLSAGIYSDIQVLENGIKVTAYEINNFTVYDSFFLPAKRNENGEKLLNDRNIDVNVKGYGTHCEVDVTGNFNGVKKVVLEKQDETVIEQKDPYKTSFVIENLTPSHIYNYQIRMIYEDGSSKVERFNFTSGSCISIEEGKLSLSSKETSAVNYNLVINGDLVGKFNIDHAYDISSLGKGRYLIEVEQLDESDEILSKNKLSLLIK